MDFPLDSVSFIPPQNAPADFTDSLKGFPLDPAIPLPVRREAPEALSGDGEIPGEMILAGILSVFAYDPENEHAGYYRRLLLRARPGIKQELSAAALLKARNDDFALAEEICLALRGLSPEDGLCALNYAAVLDRKGEFYRRSGLHEDADACEEEARRYYQRAMEEDIPEAHFNGGLFFFRRRDFARAKDCFETYIALAQGLSGGEGADEKIGIALDSIEYIDTQNLEDERFKSAYELISSGQEEKGIRLIRDFLEAHGDVWNAWFLLGWGLRLLGRFGDAKRAFRQAVRCGGGGTGDTWNELAICDMELGLYAESEGDLLSALELNPEDPKIMSNMGVLKLKTHNKTEAATWFRAALEYNPGDPIARAALDNL
ncbi:MAG: hypothetical protein LBR23_06250 [Spirochaetaceae bacterium]|jgi:Flp pilus assembly protein TadD|nr:hypothetical protein [Spirochaetaceae bacterium]